MDLSVIIVNYPSASYALYAIGSILKQEVKSEKIWKWQKV